eukprot:TRINITY_DN2589_c0_g1_i13.p2 TRINITY_DN2589_c0_g1~~TRINITY_DN2589_c0_g1_i13.p2  ORF type:complete len:182 (-),score=30.07 TRINITY_DN2589_c0_g1_i13:842-1387(-)
MGLIKKPDPKGIPPHPHPLPEDLEWCEIDVTDEKILNEVYELLRDNYIEDHNGGFRMKFSRECLKWVFTRPKYYKSWSVGMRRKDTKELVVFAGAVSASISIDGAVFHIAEPSFGTVKAEYRKRRLTPLFLLEQVRRFNLEDVWFFCSSAETIFHAPFSETWFYRRELDFKFILDVSVLWM